MSPSGEEFYPILPPRETPRRTVKAFESRQFQQSNGAESTAFPGSGSSPLSTQPASVVPSSSRGPISQPFSTVLAHLAILVPLILLKALLHSMSLEVAIECIANILLCNVYCHLVYCNKMYCTAIYRYKKRYHLLHCITIVLQCLITICNFQCNSQGRWSLVGSCYKMLINDSSRGLQIITICPPATNH